MNNFLPQTIYPIVSSSFDHLYFFTNSFVVIVVTAAVAVGDDGVDKNSLTFTISNFIVFGPLCHSAFSRV